MVDVIGVALVQKTREEARWLISIMAANLQQFGFRQDYPVKRVNEVSGYFVQQQLNNLTSLVEKLVVGNMQLVKTCGICTTLGHSTNICPML